MSQGLGALTFTQCYPSYTVVPFWVCILFQRVQSSEATRHLSLLLSSVWPFSKSLGTVPGIRTTTRSTFDFTSSLVPSPSPDTCLSFPAPSHPRSAVQSWTRVWSIRGLGRVTGKILRSLCGSGLVVDVQIFRNLFWKYPSDISRPWGELLQRCRLVCLQTK